MPPLFSLIKVLHPSKSQSAVKARLVRGYDVPAAGNRREINNYECIFHDVEGNRIQATIQRPLIPRFKPMLDEGQLYGIKNFIVTHNNNKYRTTRNKYRIIIVNKTQICQLFDETFPRKMFQFKTFEQITSMENIYDAELFDVIGILASRADPQTRVSNNGTETKLIEFVLQDKEKRKLNCTLWENYADELLELLRTQSEKPNVVILQMAKPNMFRGDIRACNAYYVTKVHLNGDLPEVNEFRNSLDDDLSIITTVESVSHGFAQIGQSIGDELSGGVNVLKNIEQLFDEEECGNFWILATIVAVEGDRGWAYVGCKRCAKKLTNVGQHFFCEKCKRYDQLGNLRYKLKVHVVDETGSAPFLLCDRECLQLLGKPAGELNSKDDLEEGVPAEIEQAMLDRKLLFRVQVNGGQSVNNGGAYSVQKITTDPTIIATYSVVDLDSQESNSVSKMESSTLIEEKVDKETEMETPSNGETSNKSLDEGLKRSLIDEFSSTVPLKKVKVFIKKEKE